MRNFILFALLFATILATSCSKDIDYTDPESLAGTTWKATSGTDWDSDVEYVELNFTSTTRVDLHMKVGFDEDLLGWSGSFTISNDRIALSKDGEGA